VKRQFPKVVASEFYAQAQAWCIWSAADAAADEPSLLKAFELAATSGRKSSGHSVKTRKRVGKELKDLQAHPIDNVELFVQGDDIFALQLLVRGPAGSPYEAGAFRLQVTIPSQYPLAPPEVTFKTKIFHCNITTAGAPCPNLLYGAQWSPNTNIRYMLVQVLELLANQSPADSLNSSAGKLFGKSQDEFNAAAREFAAQHADPASERAMLEAALREEASGSSKGGGGDGKDKEKFTWPHNYLVIEGDFLSADGDGVYDLPLIQVFTDAGDVPSAGDAAKAAGEARAALKAATAAAASRKTSGGGSGGSSSTAAVAVAAAVELPADSELGKAILATKLELEDVQFTPQKIYHMSDERSALYLRATKQAPGQFTVAVVCNNEDEDELQELVLLIPDGAAAIAAASPDTGLSEAHFTILSVTDVIMAEDTTVSSCVEYRFGPEDTWTLCETTADNMANFRSVKFDLYEKLLRSVPVPCMKSLSRLLGNGPVDRLFDPNFLNPDREAWQVLNEATGKLTDIPRPVTEMRVWNCEEQTYEDFDARLEGAPQGAAAGLEWFVNVVKFLKANLGGEGNTSLGIAQMWSTELNDKMGELGFTNQWTELVLSLNPQAEWGLTDE
jgi:ubiquitin-protein ligase